MRRPSPLPPSAAGAPPAAGAPRAGADVPETDAVAVDPDDAETLATVVPFALPTRPEGAGPVSTGDERPAGDEGHLEGEAAPLGLRDVWRASRARRRALRAEVRRFTVRQRRRRMLWLGVAGAVLLLIAGTVGAAYSPLFAVRRIEVIGTAQLDPAAVAQALDGQLDTPLALVDDSAVKAALVQFPLIESYTLEARPPNDLVVRIVERTPIGVVESAAGFTVVDAAGVALSTTPTASAGQPILSVQGGRDSDAFRAVGQVMRSLPESIRPQVTEVSASTPDDVALTLGATGTKVVWGSAEESAMKASVLEATMRNRPPDTVSLYDVSTWTAIVVG